MKPEHLINATAPAFSGVDYLIVGAGFAGSVLAERLAHALDLRVLVVERGRISAAMRTTGMTTPAC